MLKDIFCTFIDIICDFAFYLDYPYFIKIKWKRAFKDLNYGNRLSVQILMDHYSQNKIPIPLYAYKPLTNPMKIFNSRKHHLYLIFSGSYFQKDMLWYVYKKHMRGKEWDKKLYSIFLWNVWKYPSENQFDGDQLFIFYKDLKKRRIDKDINDWEYKTLLLELLNCHNINTLTFSNLMLLDNITNEYHTLRDSIEKHPAYNPSTLPLVIDILS